jgi:hypothetical protein
VQFPGHGRDRNPDPGHRRTPPGAGKTPGKETRKPYNPIKFPAATARGKHPVPFRTRKLSPSAPMVLRGRPRGRAGHRRNTLHEGVDLGIRSTPVPARGRGSKDEPRPGFPGDTPGPPSADDSPSAPAPWRSQSQKAIWPILRAHAHPLAGQGGGTHSPPAQPDPRRPSDGNRFLTIERLESVPLYRQ